MIVLAVGCHPDDIEFMMAGTLILLREAGCGLHYLTVANGSCGTAELPVDKIVSIRRDESIAAAETLGALYHESFCNDLEVYYTQELIRKLTAVVRSVKPDIMLVPSLEDYMEDHMNTARIAVTAAFCRSMINYWSIPEEPVVDEDIMIYHAMPHILTDGMRKKIVPESYIDITDVMDLKAKALSCHKSQKGWLDKTQGMGSYLGAMRDISEEVGKMSGTYRCAEAWRRHSHVGFSARDSDTLRELLPGRFRSG